MTYYSNAISLRTRAIRQAARRAHSAEVETQVDRAAAELWGITDRELKEIRRSLEELG